MNVFDGLKVLDIGSFVAAPMATTILADFGADVIKIEPPGGDGYRRMYQLPNLPKSAHNYAWMLASRNKRALVLDLKLPAGQDVLHRLVQAADVVVTNYPLRVRERLGLAYPQLRRINPRLIYASLTGYGERGPDVDKLGFDATAYWARSGLADIVRTDAQAEPVVPAMAMGDQPTAVALYAAIVTALYRRERSGEGAEVTSSLLANGIWANGPMQQAALCGAETRYRQPRATPRSALSNFYRCRDGRWFSIAMVEEEKLWPEIARRVGIEHLMHDERFSTLPVRRANAPALVVELDRVFAQHDSAEWTKRFEGTAVTASVVAVLDDVAQDPQVQCCGALVKTEGVKDVALTIDSPFWITGVSKRRPGPAPVLGEHSDEVLREYGFDTSTIVQLRRDRVVG